jgi:hypothetical protein
VTYLTVTWMSGAVAKFHQSFDRFNGRSMAKVVQSRPSLNDIIFNLHQLKCTANRVARIRHWGQLWPAPSIRRKCQKHSADDKFSLQFATIFFLGEKICWFWLGVGQEIRGNDSLLSGAHRMVELV